MQIKSLELSIVCLWTLGLSQIQIRQHQNYSVRYIKIFAKSNRIGKDQE